MKKSIKNGLILATLFSLITLPAFSKWSGDIIGAEYETCGIGENVYTINFSVINTDSKPYETYKKLYVLSKSSLKSILGDAYIPEPTKGTLDSFMRRKIEEDEELKEIWENGGNGAQKFTGAHYYGFAGKTGQKGRTECINTYSSNSTLQGSSNIINFPNAFYYAFYLTYSNPNPNNTTLGKVCSYGGEGGSPGILWTNDDGSFSSICPAKASYICGTCKKLACSKNCKNDAPDKATKGRTYLGSASDGNKKDKCESGDIILNGAGKCAKGNNGGRFNYQFKWQMQIGSDYLSYGEPGTAGEYITKKTSISAPLEIIPGDGGIWNSVEEFKTNGGNGKNGEATKIDSKGNDQIHIIANGGIGGKGGLKTKRFNLCQKGVDSLFDVGCKDRDTTEINVTTPKDSAFATIGALTNNSDLTKNNNIAGSAGMGGGTKSLDNFVCGIRKIVNLTAPENVSNVITDSSGSSGCNHRIEYIEPTDKINGKSGAVIITW